MKSVTFVIEWVGRYLTEIVQCILALMTSTVLKNTKGEVIQCANKFYSIHSEEKRM